ncbi:MAG TPA: CHRD domain-containing protein [Gemmatimonadales bacterium]|nr:CHRD domain-containing protein [Gemmatimonadales bacterium]
MNGFSILKIAVAALLPTVPACGDDEPAGPATSFAASLSGANEVPAVTTTATGSATLSVSGDQITYTINVTNLQNAILGHIHIAPAGQNGPVRLNLCGTGAPEPACTSGTGVLATGTNGTTFGDPPITFDSLLSAMRTGGAYVNVHTNAPGCTPGEPGCNPGGEIRGQVVPN